MQYFIQTNKKKLVTAVYSLSDNNILKRISAQGVAYPILESIDWEKINACDEVLFKTMEAIFLESCSNIKRAVPKRFKPNSKFNIYVGTELIMSGYSEKDRQSLCYFVQDMKGRTIEIKDERGVAKGLLHGDITAVATYAFFDI